MTDRDVLIVIPTLDERENLAELLAGVRRHAPGADVLIVDDGSTDGTAELATEIDREHGGVHVLERGERLGIGSAYREGFALGLERGYRRLISMDGDLSHEPRYLPELIAATDRADVAVGSRYLHGVSVVNWGLDRLILSVAANRYARVVTGLPIWDCTSGFQCFRREVLEAIGVPGLRFNGYAFLVELKVRSHQLGFRLEEVPIIFVDRRYGFSKLGAQHLMESALGMWRLRFDGRRRRAA